MVNLCVPSACFVFLVVKKQPKPQSARRNTHKERKDKYKVVISGHPLKFL